MAPSNPKNPSEKVVCSLPLADVLKTLEAAGLLVEHSAKLSLPRTPAMIKTNAADVGPGDIFLVYKGVKHDHHKNIESIIFKKPGLIIFEDLAYKKAPKAAPWICVKSSRAAWAHLCSRAFDDSHKHLDVIAVTGTNGKTSTVWLVKAILEKVGHKSLSLGTLGAFLGSEHHKLTHTTPDPPDLYYFLNKAVLQKIKFGVMEASSFAVLQEKLGPIKFSASAFTSFSRDHLDLHPTMEDYFHNKWLIFSSLTKADARVAYADQLETYKPLPVFRDGWVFGSNARKIAKQWKVPNYLQFEFKEQTISGCHLEVESSLSLAPVQCRLPLIGHYAASNFLTAYLLASKFVTLPALDDKNFWADLPQIPGRLEICNRFKNFGKEPCVIVDYAHTPDAIAGVLQTLRPLCKGKLWVVFGCGGDRDPGKRPLMAKAAEQYADLVVVSTDNPRSEDPQAIADQTKAGLKKKENLALVNTDRRSAITDTIKRAGKNDIVIIAGKGHEDYMVLKDKTIDFDDRLVAKEALSLL